jgi:hypothetical protein
VAAVLREVPVLLAVDVVLQPGVSVLRCAALAHAQHMLAGYRLAAVAEVDAGSLWPVGGSPRAVQCVVAVNGATPPAATSASAAIVDVGGAAAAQSAAPPAGESRADGGAWSAQPAPATAPDGWMLAACSTVGAPPACTSILIHRDEPAASLYRRLVATWPASATAGLAGLLAWHATAQGFVPLRGDAVTPAATSLHVDPSQSSPSEVWIAVPAAGGLAQAWASWLPPFTPSPPLPPAGAAAGPWSASAPLDARAPPWRPASTRGVPAAAFAGWPAVDHAGAGPLYGTVGVGGSRSRQADGGGLHPRTLAGLAHLRECAATMARTSDLDDGDGWAAVVDLAQLREALQALCDATFGDKGMSMRMGSRTAATTPTDGVREALFDAGVVTEATTVLAHVPHASTVHRQVLEQAIQLCTNIAFNSRAQLAMAAPDQQVTSVLCRRMVADGDCPEIQIKVRAAMAWGHVQEGQGGGRGGGRGARPCVCKRTSDPHVGSAATMLHTPTRAATAVRTSAPSAPTPARRVSRFPVLRRSLCATPRHVPLARCRWHGACPPWRSRTLPAWTTSSPAAQWRRRAPPCAVTPTTRSPWKR